MPSRYGQNFLVDKNIAVKIVELAAVDSDSAVIEIGPGKGILTELLCRRAKNVLAFELDTALADRLNSGLAKKYPNLNVINSDILKVNLDEVLSQGRYIVVGNLPYYISSAIVSKIIKLPFRHAVFTFQKEVAQRITAGPDSRNPKVYGYLSLVVACYADSKLVFDIPASAFKPAPKIVSSVVKIMPKKESVFNDARDIGLFLKVIEAAFSQRRKTLINSISTKLKLPKEKLQAAIVQLKIQPKARAEEVEFETYVNLTFCLKKDIICE